MLWVKNDEIHAKKLLQVRPVTRTRWRKKEKKQQEILLRAFCVRANAIRTKTKATSRKKKLKKKETFEMCKQYIH